MKTAVLNRESDTQLKVVRGFNAPIDLVWKSFTEVNLICEWMAGPPGWTMPVCEMDFQIGGMYKNFFRNDADGIEIQIVGTIQEVEPLVRIVQNETHIIGGVKSNTTVTLTFQEAASQTTVTTLIEYGSKKECDDALATGMEAAMEIGYSRIDDILIEL